MEVSPVVLLATVDSSSFINRFSVWLSHERKTPRVKNNFGTEMKSNQILLLWHMIYTTIGAK